MTVKTILAYIPGAKEAAQTLPVAVDLCRRTGAHLIGLHVKESLVLHSTATMYGAIPDLPEFNAAQEESERAARERFLEATDAEDFAAEWRPATSGAADGSDQILAHARAADLVVMPQPGPDAKGPDPEMAVQRTIRKSGRPVLVVPYAGEFRSVGDYFLIGWSPTREAARAAHDVISIVAPGARATILNAHHKSDKARLPVETAKELALCYDRHGISAEVVDRTEDEVAVGSVLLNEAFERGADMIVTGAFGHSRVYDFVIGATTTHLLESMTAPVLFSR